MIPEDVIQRVADSAESIMILTSCIWYLVRQIDKLQKRLDACLARFEQHLEDHEKIG